MPVNVVHVITRSKLEDMFWFELPMSELEIENFSIFNGRVVDSYPINDNSNEEIRPDILDMIRLGEITQQEALHLVSTATKANLIFNNLEEFRQANQDLFNSIGEIILTKVKQTNNTIQEKVYDENGVFLENGLFNQE